MICIKYSQGRKREAHTKLGRLVGNLSPEDLRLGMRSLYMLDISPLSDLGLVKILSQSVGGLFILLTVSFASRSFVIL